MKKYTPLILMLAAGLFCATLAWSQGTASKPAPPPGKAMPNCPYADAAHCPMHDEHMSGPMAEHMEMMQKHMEAMKEDLAKMQAELNNLHMAMSEMKTEDPALRKTLESNAALWTMLVNHMKAMSEMCDKMCARMGAWHGHDMHHMPPHWTPKQAPEAVPPASNPPSNRK